MKKVIAAAKPLIRTKLNEELNNKKKGKGSKKPVKDVLSDPDFEASLFLIPSPPESKNSMCVKWTSEFENVRPENEEDEDDESKPNLRIKHSTLRLESKTLCILVRPPLPTLLASLKGSKSNYVVGSSGGLESWMDLSQSASYENLDT